MRPPMGTTLAFWISMDRVTLAGGLDERGLPTVPTLELQQCSEQNLWGKAKDGLSESEEQKAHSDRA